VPHIQLQPKQERIRQMVYRVGYPTWVGMPGSRGGAKSGCIDRLMLMRRMALPGTIGVIVMRNWDQVRDYHVDVMKRQFPELEPWYNAEKHSIAIPCGKNGEQTSEIHFSYAETLKDVERRFRSASFYDIFVDQAEQFTEAELREMKQACRWANAPQGACKLLLAFNMGGAGIDFLRKKFHLKEFNANERKEDYDHVRVFTWDNVEWVRPALETDGLTPNDYYAMSEEQRKEYCAARSDYGRNLVSQDAALVKRDWDGSWDALEGTYFGRVWDRDAAVISREQFNALVKPWWARWLAQDWGKGHFCPTLWNARGDVSPEEVKDVLGWEIDRPIRLTITYREYIAGGAAASDEGADRELGEQDIAREIVERTPEEERKRITQFFLSPDAFEMSVRRVGQSQIADLIKEVMREYGMPAPIKANNSRVDGWSLMYDVLLSTKRRGDIGDDAWLVTEDCPQLTHALPLLMRDPKNLDDVLKTDKGSAKIEQDMGDAARYALKSVLRPRAVPEEEKLRKKLANMPPTATMTQKHMVALKHQAEAKRRQQPVTMSGDWRRRLEE
jgi:hypothetical protein